MRFPAILPWENSHDDRPGIAMPDADPPAHQPYVPDHVTLPEFTWLPVLMGAVLGIIFGASSLYLVLRVGMTVSASIPVAVLSITLFRVFSSAFGIRKATILENNIVQTAGSAGESIAFGVGVTMPSVMLLGFEMDVGRIMVVSVLGGLLGILMMIPLRRAFIVKQHGKLIYPEGTACADVLIIGETGGTSAKTVFVGFGLAFLFKFLMSSFKFWADTISQPIKWLKGGTFAMDMDITLLGVGYIIGTRISCIMVAGGLLSWLVLCPTIAYFSRGAAHLGPEAMVGYISDHYIVYIGAGAVAAGGIISMIQAMPLILSSIVAGLRDLRSGGEESAEEAGEKGTVPICRNGPPGASHKWGLSPFPRTDRDLSIRFVLYGSLALVMLIWIFLGADPQAGGGWSLAAVFNWVNLLAAVLIVLFGFLFVTVSSRLTGEIGSSSNPISGMTIATLLLTCLIFLILGRTAPQYRLVAISIAAVVCIASSNGGTTSQDLKTGFLVGATPKWQQLSILVGSVSSALVIGVILVGMNRAGTIYSQKNLNQPKRPLDMAQLRAAADRETVPGDPTLYYVWHAVEGNAEGVMPGRYDVDEAGKIRWLKDPGINGRLDQRDDGTKVPKYTQPQARLFALITDGILNRKLPWTFVALGAMIAVVIELCGVSSLAFAVGMYLPLSSSTPIFVGGFVRYMVDRVGRNKTAAPASELESEMSPGMLFSTGYIAGGSIAGVIISFLSFSDTLPKALAIGENVLPYQTAAAAFAFLVLAILLVLVGKGRMLKAKD
jgi:putative OPT family oligopeptide transporter